LTALDCAWIEGKRPAFDFDLAGDGCAAAQPYPAQTNLAVMAFEGVKHAVILSERMEILSSPLPQF
jgi:hypothetical protein